MNPDTPSLFTKVFFWILLGILSVFFAEVVVASDPYPFLHLWGLLVVIPLYLLHIVVLAKIGFKAPKLSFALLFFLGIVFGLYEAYMTKVIWDPPWGPMYYLGGIAPIQTVVLTLWWHPWMAFIVPLLVGEVLLTRSREVLGTLFPWLQAKLKKPLLENVALVVFLVLCGLVQSSNSSTWQLSGLSFFSTGIVTVGLMMVWHWVTWDKNYSMRSLMPEGEQFWVLLVLLVGMYGFLGRMLRPESIPGVTGQVIIIAIYAVLAFLITLIIRRSTATPSQSGEPASAWSLIRILSALVIIIVAAIDGHLILGKLRTFIIPILWLLGSVTGIIILVWNTYGSLANRSSEQ